MQIDAKKAAAKAALSLIENNMIVGLGSGTTTEIFIKYLSEECKNKLQIQAVSSSRKSSEIAEKGGIEVLDINSVSHIDITVDGADEIDPKKRMIKGGGGAHLREKILAASSLEMVVIIDETKLSENLGKHKLPLEVAFFGSPATKAKIESLGFSTKWRKNPDETLYITENGNLILDIYFKEPITNPEELENQLKKIPGVLDTGFFFHLAGRVIVGKEDGTTYIW